MATWLIYTLVDVEARGIPVKSFYKLIKDLGLSRTTVSFILECSTPTKGAS